MKAANMIEFEKVHVLNINNGERIETYVIKGKKGSGVICLNGAVRQNALRNIHLGAKLNDNIAYSEETYRLNTQASVSALNDVVVHVTGKNYRDSQIRSITKASEITIEPESALKRLPI